MLQKVALSLLQLMILNKLKVLLDIYGYQPLENIWVFLNCSLVHFRNLARSLE